MGKREIEALLKPGVKIVVTVSEWIMTPDGDYYKYFFGQRPSFLRSSSVALFLRRM